jgi:hypothetical protein
VFINDPDKLSEYGNSWGQFVSKFALIENARLGYYHIYGNTISSYTDATFSSKIGDMYIAPGTGNLSGSDVFEVLLNGSVFGENGTRLRVCDEDAVISVDGSCAIELKSGNYAVMRLDANNRFQLNNSGQANIVSSNGLNINTGSGNLTINGKTGLTGRIVAEAQTETIKYLSLDDSGQEVLVSQRVVTGFSYISTQNGIVTTTYNP